MTDKKVGQQLGETLAPFVVVFYFFLLGMFMVVLAKVGYFIVDLIW